jgi:hypothetical protein
MPTSTRKKETKTDPKAKRTTKSTKRPKKEKASSAVSHAALSRRTQNTAFLLGPSPLFRTGLGETPAARWPFPTTPTLH